MKRTARDVSWVVAQGLLTMLGMAALVFLYFVVTTGSDGKEYAAGAVLGILCSVSWIFPMLLEMNLMAVRLPVTLQAGVTRRGCFAGFFLAKLEFAFGTAAILWVSQMAVQIVFVTEPVFTGQRLLSMLALMLISASAGETLGVLGLRFGRTVMLIFSLGIGILCGLSGGVIGFLSVNNRLASIFSTVMQILAGAPVLCGVALVLTAGLSALDWHFWQRLSV